MVVLFIHTDLFLPEMLSLLLKNESVHFAWLKSRKEQSLGEGGELSEAGLCWYLQAGGGVNGPPVAWDYQRLPLG